MPLQTGSKSQPSSSPNKGDGKSSDSRTPPKDSHGVVSSGSQDGGDPMEGDPSTQLEIKEKSGGIISQSSGLFQLFLYMKHFRATDIIVKVVDGNIIIDASHKFHVDEHGLVKRSMCRKHPLPTSVKVKDLICLFTGNGFLLIQEMEKEPDYPQPMQV